MFKDKTGKQLSTTDAAGKMRARFLSILLELEVYILHLVGNVPFHHKRRFFYRAAGMKIGKGSTIHMYTRFYDPRNIVVGNDTIIGEFAILDGRHKLRIGDHVAIASHVSIYNSEHAIDSDDFRPITEPVVIEDYVFIGPNAVILPGVTIGRGAVVAAGAVVTKDIPPLSIVGGVPAKVIGERKNKDLNYFLGRSGWFR
jgi:maltose O-acetyltransferase